MDDVSGDVITLRALGTNWRATDRKLLRENKRVDDICR